MRFRWRLALYGAGVTALVMLLFGGLLAGIAENAGPDDQARNLQTAAEVFATNLDGTSLERLRGYPDIGTVDVATSLDSSVILYSEAAGPIGGTAFEAGAPVDLQPDEPFDYSTGVDTELETSTGTRVRTVGAPFVSADGTRMLAIVLQPVAAIDEQLQGLRAVIWIAALIAFLVALVASWLVSGRALRPLRRLAATADEIRDTGDLSRRLPDVRSTDELGRITNSFNEMVSNLESSQSDLASALDAQRRFVADASHELRSPLTTIRNNAEFLSERTDVDPADRAEAIADISAEATRMTNLVDDLLALASGELLERRERVAVEDLLDNEAERLRRTGETVDVHVERGSVLGDRTALERLLRILSTNALHHGRGPLTLRCGHRRGQVFFGVADRGEGFPTDDLVQVFDRFFRADQARTRTGTGLGLAIAHQIALAHGGQIVAANRPGGGAVVEVELPPANDHPDTEPASR
ncbi:MAG: HAMP domain-containing histidine kinase [Acidimicrobiia bacterium]|nr:HAMP domain-containing histidine kinase [Acidimicrobiia bacterium]